MNTKHLFFVLAFCTACGLVRAQEVMTLEKCRSLALENNKAGAIAALHKEKAVYTQKAYRANYFPKFSASGNYLHSNMRMTEKIPEAYLPIIGAGGIPVFNEYAYFPGMDFSLKLKNLWMAGVSAEQPLYMGGKITAAYKMAKTGDEIATLNRQLTRAEILVKTDEAYWTYVRTGELVKLALSYQKVLGELLRNVQAAEEVGMKHRNDVLKVQVKANEAELQLRQAENGMRLARKNLCHVMGIPLDSSVTLPESFENDGWSAVSEAADATGYRSRPEYAILEKQVQLKEQEVKLVRSDFLPHAGVTANYGYTDGLLLNGNKLFNRASFSVLASVSVPLFHWGEGHHKVRAAKAERTAAQLQRDDLSEQMALELARTADKCDESALEVQLTARALEQAEENRKISGLQYEGGMETLSDYLEAQTVWQRARMEHVNALTQQRLNRTYYLKAAGRLE